MSTTLTTLEVDASIMRELYTDVFADMTVAELKALKKTIAKNELKSDLYSAFRIEPDDTSQLTDLDTVVDKYSTQLQAALMYLQCYYYFKEHDEIDGKNAKRMQDCRNDYKAIKAKFSDWWTDNVATTTVACVMRG